MTRKERKKYNQKYTQKNREKISNHKKDYYQNHKAEIIEKVKNYAQMNSKKVKEGRRRYYQEHRKELDELKRVYRHKNKEKFNEKARERLKKYRKTEKGTYVQKFNNYKRKNLDSIQVNKPFEGSVSHHIDKIHVIFIPEEIHKSVYHNIWTGKNMEIINKLAFEFLEGTNL